MTLALFIAVAQIDAATAAAVAPVPQASVSPLPPLPDAHLLRLPVDNLNELRFTLSGKSG
jgi:hypothetical protein